MTCRHHGVNGLGSGQWTGDSRWVSGEWCGCSVSVCGMGLLVLFSNAVSDRGIGQWMRARRGSGPGSRRGREKSDLFGGFRRVRRRGRPRYATWWQCACRMVRGTGSGAPGHRGRHDAVQGSTTHRGNGITCLPLIEWRFIRCGARRPCGGARCVAGAEVGAGSAEVVVGRKICRSMAATSNSCHPCRLEQIIYVIGYRFYIALMRVSLQGLTA